MRARDAYKAASYASSQSELYSQLAMAFQVLVLVACLYLTTTAWALVVQTRQDPRIERLTYDPQLVYDIDYDLSTGGGCGGPYKSKVQRGYNDAIGMLLAAKQAMIDLEQPMPDDKDKAAQNEWKRKAQAFRTIFGSPIKETQGHDIFADNILSMPPEPRPRNKDHAVMLIMSH